MKTYRFYTVQGVFTYSAYTSYEAVQALLNDGHDLVDGDTMASWDDTIEYKLDMLNQAYNELQQEIDYLLNNIDFTFNDVKMRKKWVTAHVEQAQIEKEIEYLKTTMENDNPFNG